MEAVEELAAAPPGRNNNNNDTSPIAKGKRTKRQRTTSPIHFTVVGDTANHHSSPVSSEESTTTADDVDAARCLILLSRGDHDNKRYTHTAAAGIYTCKTCNRAFASFQALGGHRASHKKPKNEKKYAIFSDEEDFPSPSSSKNRNISPNSLSLQLSNISTTTLSATLKSSAAPSPRMHQCSYCGAEFTSGQALGGHMRKHRGVPTGRSMITIDELKQEELKNPTGNVGLCLDLNFPAPEDEKEKCRQEIDQPLLLHP